MNFYQLRFLFGVLRICLFLANFIYKIKSLYVGIYSPT